LEASLDPGRDVASSFRKGARADTGLTLIELLIVMFVLAILLALAVPAYLRFSDRAENAAAPANIRAALPAVQAYHTDHAGYGGMTAAALRAEYDSELQGIEVLSANDITYCLKSFAGTAVAYMAGPDAQIVVNPSPPPCS
jgi:prepilin-type N-terminal cleavage/methylation domain-containing protein